MCKEMLVPETAETNGEAQKALDAAMVLNTKEYFVRHIEQAPDKAHRKITNRLQQISNKFSYELVHATIRAKVTELTGL